MQKFALPAAAAAIFLGNVAIAQPTAESGAPAPAPRLICQYVVGPERGAKPERLCMTRADWDAKELEDAKDANRIVCHYEQLSGTRFRSAKVCMPASQWAEQRRLERESVDQIQRSVCVSGAGC